MKRVWIPQAIVCAMLLWALHPENPYGYYILLRWICCAIFAFLSFKAIDAYKKGWAWILGVTALIYNPIFRVHLNRELWLVVNIVTVIIAFASVFTLSITHKNDSEGARK